jgi:hypothetical protein
LVVLQSNIDGIPVKIFRFLHCAFIVLVLIENRVPQSEILLELISKQKVLTFTIKGEHGAEVTSIEL